MMAHLNPLGRGVVTKPTSRPINLASATTDPDRASSLSRVGVNDVDLFTYIAKRGFHFQREIVTRYLLALRSKPFVLFTGISGTGKTKLALLAAEYFARVAGTQAARWEQPEDSDHEFFLPITNITLRSGTLIPGRDQLDYFNVPAGASETFTANITNLLGAHGDITFRATNLVSGGKKNLTVQVPSSVRRAMEETGVTNLDYLRFEIVEEFKRFRVSLFRPQSELVEIPAQNRYAFISVRPSWSDHTALLGQWDSRLERYERTPLLELLLRAGREERDAKLQGRAPAPYFVILDEMNLARIEHYFSDFLSALESRRVDENGRIIQEAVHLHSADASEITWMDELGIEYVIPQNIEIPTNVVFTGTLNIDDSTAIVSPKVIDRASTIGFSSVDLESYLSGSDPELGSDPLEIDPERTRSGNFLGELKLSSADDARAMSQHLGILAELNDILIRYDQHFGYRVLNDVALYLRETHDLVGSSVAALHAAVDACVLQKVLPKFTSWQSDRGGMLALLLEYCLHGKIASNLTSREINDLLAECEVDARDRAFFVKEDERDVYLPRSAGRLIRMLRYMS